MSDKTKLIETLKSALDSALGSVWEDVCNELKKEIYAELCGYDQANLRVINGTTGDEWWTAPLSKLVDEFIEIRDGALGDEEIEWCEAIASDMEHQAARLRAHAKQLQQKS